MQFHAVVTWGKEQHEDYEVMNEHEMILKTSHPKQEEKTKTHVDFQ